MKWLFKVLLLLVSVRVCAVGDEVMVVVPFDPEVAVEAQVPDSYFLGYEAFQGLWEAAKVTRRERGEVVGEPPVGVKEAVIGQALYEVAIGEERLDVVGRLRVVGVGDGWFEVPFGFGGLALAELKVDGVAGVQRDGALLVSGGGQHEVEVAFSVPVRKGWKEVTLTVPRASASMVVLEKEAGAGFSPVVVGRSAVVQGQRSTVVLGNAEEMTVRRETETLAAVEGRVASARVKSRDEIGAGVERFHWEVMLDVASAAMERFSVRVPAGIRVAGLEIPGVREWMLDGSVEAGQRLTFRLEEATTGEVGIGLVGERAVAGLPRESSHAVLGVPAGRVEREVTVVGGDGVAVKTSVAGGARPAGAGVFRWETGAGGLSYGVSRAVREPKAKVVTVFQIGASKVETVVMASLDAGDGGALLDVRFGLPEGVSVEMVDGPTVREWWLDGDVLVVRTEKGARQADVLLNLVRPLDGLPDELELVGVELEGFDDESGIVVVVGHKAVDVVLALEGDAAARAREVPVAEVAGGVEVVAPLELKRGFRYSAPGAVAKVRLAELEARFDSRWVMRAGVHDTWVGYSTFVDIEVTRAALDSVEFVLPAALPVARVSGEEVREVRSTVDGDERRTTVFFQGDVFGAVGFEVAFETAHDGSTPVPALRIEGATREERYFVIENASDGELRVEATGAEVTTRESVPVLPDGLGAAEYYRAVGDYEMGLELEALESMAGAKVLVTLGEITTALRRNGEVWHRAVYRMQNRSLQFLPVRLPAGTELVSAMVAEQTVRADRGEDGELLVPLIQTKAGQLAYSVELVYRSKSGDSGLARGRVSTVLEDPELVGLAVQETLWSVYPPQGYGFEEAEGNMRRIEEARTSIAKLKELVAEIADLNKLASSSSLSLDVRNEALGNAGSLAEQVEEEFGQAWANYGEPVQTGAAGQQVGQELQDVGEQLKQQQIVITSNRIELPTFASQGPGAGLMEAGERTEGIKGWGYNWLQLVERKKNTEKQVFDQEERVKEQVALNDNLFVGNQFFKSGGAQKKEAAAESDVGQAVFNNRARAVDLGNKLVKGKAVEVPQGAVSDDPFAVGNDVGGGGLASPVVPKQEAFRPVGRVSLPVSFPVAGEAWHFQKLKGNARIEVVAGEAGGGVEAWKWWVLGGAALVVLLGGWGWGKNDEIPKYPNTQGMTNDE